MKLSKLFAAAAALTVFAGVAMADAPAGTRLALTLANGQTRSLTLAAYY